MFKTILVIMSLACSGLMAQFSYEIINEKEIEVSYENNDDNAISVEIEYNVNGKKIHTKKVTGSLPIYGYVIKRLKNGDSVAVSFVVETDIDEYVVMNGDVPYYMIFDYEKPDEENVKWIGEYSSAPILPKKGQAYHNTTEDQSFVYYQEEWKPFAKGEKGDKGDQGVKGDKGDKGDQGIQGVKGDKGDMGDQGIQGVKGDKGDMGDQGLKGDKGDKGDQGIQGVKGDKGDTGPRGPIGPQGFPGPKGDKGDPMKLGAWATKSRNTNYHAATDGMVIAQARSFLSGRNTAQLIGITDGSNPPSRDVAYDLGYNNDGPAGASITMPVRKGDYWRVEVMGGTTVKIYWIPIGN